MYTVHTMDEMNNNEIWKLESKSQQETADTVGEVREGNCDVKRQDSPAQETSTDDVSTCLVCGKKDRAIEFILPGLYCSQLCADKEGSSICEDPSKPSRTRHSTEKRLNGIASDVQRGKRRTRGTDGSRQNGVTFDLSGQHGVKPSRFNWEKFLEEENLVAAPSELFSNQPPITFTNTFTVGMKMEAIDPQHPALFCVVTVAEVKGYRIRLHFDGYLDCHDFWTYAYSDEIFPVGWCEENGKRLNPPQDMAMETFNWERYLQLTKSTAAPRSCFTVCTKQFGEKKPAFNVGDKLEAVDIKNKNTYVCVASVADTYADKILVHFDGWQDNYDYWCYYNSAHIHPVGWCQDTLKTLSAPNGYVDPSTFTWDSYLAETNSRAAPVEGFQPIVAHGFEAKMALEVVDKRNATLVRVGEIIEVLDTGLLIHFSGWDNKYDYWEQADSLDLHPVGWCERTGHPLQPPLTPLDIVNYSGVCPTLGCYGYGHVKGATFATHYSLSGCPYADVNLHRNNIILDRISSKKHVSSLESSSLDTNYRSIRPLMEQNHHRHVNTASFNGGTDVSRYRKRSLPSGGGKGKHARKASPQMGDVSERYSHEETTSHTPKATPTPAIPSPQAKFQNYIHDSVFLPAIPSQQFTQLPPGWHRNIQLLPALSNMSYTDVPKWKCKHVSDFIMKIVPNLTVSKVISDEGIDGEAFLLLTQKDITSILKVKLGPAVKIYNCILLIRKALGKG